jgi:hypothetical protein
MAGPNNFTDNDQQASGMDPDPARLGVKPGAKTAVLKPIQLKGAIFVPNPDSLGSPLASNPVAGASAPWSGAQGDTPTPVMSGLDPKIFGEYLIERKKARRVLQACREALEQVVTDNVPADVRDALAPKPEKLLPVRKRSLVQPKERDATGKMRQPYYRNP